MLGEHHVIARYITIDRLAHAPIYIQIKSGLEMAIRDGYFHKNKMPSARFLSELLEVSLNTILLALDELKAQGIVYSKPRSGLFINPESVSLDYQDIRPENLRVPTWLEAAGAQQPPESGLHVVRSIHDTQAEFPFVTASIPGEVFTASTWLNASRKALEGEHRKFCLYDGFGADDPMLLGQIMEKILHPRGVNAEHENIVLTAGAQHGLYLISQLLIAEGTAVAMEDPGYPDARHTFLRQGARVSPVPVDMSGLVVDEIAPHVKLIYTTPSHQLPSNVSMTVPRKASLVNFARKTGACIIEDDYDAEMRFVGRSSIPIAAGNFDSVIYVSSFTKYIGAMARIGFIVADRNVARELKKIRRYEIRNISGHEQRSLALFIRDGGYAKLVRSLRRVSKERWNSCQSLLNEMLPDWTAAPSVGGSNLWVAAPKGMDTMDLAKILRQEGVVIEPGSVFFAKPEDGRSFVKLGFNLMNENKQRQGFLKIKAAAERIGYGLTD